MNQIISRDVTGLAREFRGRFEGARILVTGGAGFIGSWLCDVLVEAGANVVCLDNFSTGKKENLEHLQGRIRLIEGDVESAPIPGKYDIIFHLASRASPEEYQTHPIETLKANSLGTLRILEKAVRDNSTVVYASSSEVYGDASIIPTPETYYGHVNPIGPRSCYDEGKRFGEALCIAYYRQHRANVRIARIFNTYGPRIREDGIYARALPRFISQALDNRPITIYGDGYQTRSFCYITDTISALLELSQRDDMAGEVFNIGSPGEITILELAKKIVKETNSKFEIEFLPPRPDDPKRRCPDITKATSLLGWKPKVTLDEGLRKTIQHLASKRTSVIQ
jgi:UDP-glucuronate decarboxylase